MEWREENEKLITEINCKTFTGALDFVNKVGELAEKHDHHPDILIHSYNKVQISLTTHSEGRITQKDKDLAKEIENIESN